jgi:hypothetical protein
MAVKYAHTAAPAPRAATTPARTTRSLGFMTRSLFR